MRGKRTPTLGFGHRALTIEPLEDRRLLSLSFSPTTGLNTNAGPDSGDDSGPELVADGPGNWVVAWESDYSLEDTIGSDKDILFATNTTIVGLGIAGDSLSDEYAGETYNYAQNWDEILAEVKGVNVGPQGAWGEPRRDGYEYNWARYGATTQSLLNAGQHTQLAAQIDAGLVSHAVLAIGQNDFAPSSPAYINIYNSTWTPAQIDAYAAQVVANIETALATLAATDATLVMSNIGGYDVNPSTQARYPDPDQREQVTTVIASINAELEALAAAYRVPMVDLFSLGKDLLGTNHDPIASQTVGGVEIYNRAESDPPDPTNPTPDPNPQ